MSWNRCAHASHAGAQPAKPRTPPQHHARRLAVEALEDRRLLASGWLLGSVSGTVFNDQNGDGARSAGESGLRGWVVYADSNDNGRLDRGEARTVSGRNGEYRLAVAAGTYTIREVVPDGWQTTTPDQGAYSVSVARRTSVTGADFGNQEIPAEPLDGGDFQIDLSFSGLSASAQAIVEQAAQRWEQVIVGDLPDVRTWSQTIDDVLIRVVGQSMDGIGSALAEAGPTAVRSRGGLPYQGTIVVDTADVAALESSSLLLDVITHEIAHVLGFGTLWTSRGLLTGTSTANPQYTGTQAVAEYNALFGANASGVPVEAGGGSGTALGHWRQSVFGNELMVGYAQSGGMPLSRITVAAMADLGYQVTLAAADPYPPSAASSPLASSANASGTWNTPAAPKSASPDAGAVAATGVATEASDSVPWATDSATAEGDTEPCRLPKALPGSRWHAWSAAVDDLFARNRGWA